ncbi:DUF3601 domain-containing protein [Aureimonas fodinaquatilis]|uniref:DUF3601 domain-containing protein n=1 Tax=Aureimonas fodinaquatilis TaxID=2565783 RepID=A0A5B0DWB1_9HYPH|nr:DUF3601 domain-containing protein [Aureimonas fodinaquatilis]KAA0970723.1 DUF3601 domain-containing protein [Aureimonas fodinaquatilis]
MAEIQVKTFLARLLTPMLVRFKLLNREPELTSFKHLEPGKRYRVTKGFTDYDGRYHPTGESWTFLRHSFLPYDDGLTLFVRLDDGILNTVRLQWRPDEQGPVIDTIEKHIVPN